MRLYQTVTQRSGTEDGGTIRIATADFDGDILTTTVDFSPTTGVVPGDLGFDETHKYAFRAMDRTRGTELFRDQNIHLDISGDPIQDFERDYSFPAPDNSEIEFVFDHTVRVSFEGPDGIPFARDFTSTPSAFLEVGDPASATTVAELSDRTTGTELIIPRAVRDGDAGLVELELSGNLGDAGEDGFVRIATGPSRSDVVDRFQFGRLSGSITRELTFETPEDMVVVSVVHPDLGSELIGEIPLSDGDISVPVSQLEVSGVSGRQVGQERAVDLSVSVTNQVVSDGGSPETGRIELFYLTDPDTAPDPGTESISLDAFTIDVPAGETVTRDLRVEDGRLPAGEIRFCGRLS